MFQIIPTKNYAGFELRGDSGDFRSLLSAIYYLDNEEYLRAAGYHDVMNYFFTLAFEARYALEGRPGLHLYGQWFRRLESLRRSKAISRGSGEKPLLCRPDSSHPHAVLCVYGG